MSGATVFQLLAVTDAPVEPPTDDDRPLEVVRLGAATNRRALVRPTPRDEVEGPEAEARLADLQWVTRRALAHQAAIEAAASRATACPFPLGVVFSNHAALAAFVERNDAALTAFFAEARGRSEYGVKVLATTPNAAAAEPSAPTGADRLRQKLAARKSERRRAAETDAFLARCGERLAALATDVRVRRAVAQPRDDGAVAIASFAALADPDQASALLRWVETAAGDCGRLGLCFETSGPWPAYAFCPDLE